MMREDTTTGNPKKNQMLRGSSKTNGNPPKPKSGYSWGSQIVKGFVTEKKAKSQASNAAKKLPLASLDVSTHKIQYVSYNSRVKRSLIGEFPCSPNSAQVHPHAFDSLRMRSPSSHNLFIELDNLRSLLQDSKDRELALRSELLHYKESPRVTELERELDIKRAEVESLNHKISLLEVEKTNLSEQLASLSSMWECHEDKSVLEGSQNLDSNPIMRTASYRNLEMEVVELRRLNKELQLQKRNLSFRLSSTESQLAVLAKVTECEILAKVQEEASVLRHTNEDLCKQVEGLQMSRLTEVEELAYLRWVNSCLKHELYNSDNLSVQSSDSSHDLNIIFEDKESNLEGDIGACGPTKTPTEICNAKKVHFTKKLMNGYQINGDCRMSAYQSLLDKDWTKANEGRSPQRRHSISGPKSCLEELTVNKRRQSDGFIPPKEMETKTNQDKRLLIVQKYGLGVPQSPRLLASKSGSCKLSALDVQKRALRIPNPPPRPSGSVSHAIKRNGAVPVPPPPPPPPTQPPVSSTSVSNAIKTKGSGPMLPPPPPPPPPPPKFLTSSSGVMRRAPQVAELYHSLMKRDSRKDSLGRGICEAPNVANVRSNMIGEIENRSSHLLAIKADVETQGEFVKSLIKEVNDAAYRDIEDVVAFVKWLDDELSFLVDERAVLKHFDWPEKKADTLREASFGYQDLKKLESELTNYKDDLRLPCDVALKKMVALSEKMERSVYNLLRTRDATMRHCKEYQVPTDWMLDTGIVSKIKFASVKLANKYMKRVASELQAMGASDKDPALEYMLLQGVRFAFRIHQFAGGFDSETMHAFEELRNLAHFRE